MKKSIIVIYILFITIVNTSSYAIKQDNFTIIDSMVSDASEKILKQIKANFYDEILITHNKHSVISLFTKHLFNNSDKIKFFYKSESNLPVLNLEVLYSGLKYDNYYENNDSLVRTIELKVSAYIKTKEGQIINIKLPDYKFKDLISRNDIDKLGDISFVDGGTVPQPEPTFFDEVTEPLIIITGAIITIILLFTVRSG